MPTVGRYCKAYPIQRLREFEGWRENAANARVNAEDTSPRLLTTDSFLYIHESYVVTDGIYIDQNVIFDAVDEDWKRFCAESLGFAPPGEDRGENTEEDHGQDREDQGGEGHSGIEHRGQGQDDEVPG